MDVADFDYGGFDYADEGISHTETVRTSGAAGLEDLLKYSEVIFSGSKNKFAKYLKLLYDKKNIFNLV